MKHSRGDIARFFFGSVIGVYLVTYGVVVSHLSDGFKALVVAGVVALVFTIYEFNEPDQD